MTGNTTTREPVHQTGLQQRAAQGELPRVRMDVVALSFISPDGLDGVLGDQLGVRPRQRLGQGRGEDDLDRPARVSVPGSPSLASPDMSR